MPRSRRRHHSRTRSRSRSPSHDRDRDAKRRKIDSLESPPHKRSVSCEPEIRTDREKPTVIVKEIDDSSGEHDNKVSLEEKLKITPKKAMSPVQLQKKLESEKKRQQKQLEREEREKRKLEEKEAKERVKLEKQKEKEQKEELKRKEKEEKEAKRKEKEERDEQKRKEKLQEKLRKQQEIDEKKQREEEKKQKEEEKKQKAAAAFVSFFVPKKADVTEEKKVEEDKSLFMPFQVKSDMRLPPERRPKLTPDEKSSLVNYLATPVDTVSYVKDLKNGSVVVRRSPRTWPFEDSSDDVIIVEDDFGESIAEDKPKSQKFRAKFFKFHENRRPPYFGTWRKKSKVVNPRKPFAEDTQCFDYEIDSDDDWEEEEQGESLNGSDDEADKENEVDNDDYEVDNEFFVPHGHLSDDEIDDESTAKLSPESHKQKLKLLKDEFDNDMQTKTNKIKPRSIGCVWYKSDPSDIDEAIDRFLRPLAVITEGQIIIRKRSENVLTRGVLKELKEELILPFLKIIHRNVNNQKNIVEDFLAHAESTGVSLDVSKTQLIRCLKSYAQWKKCTEDCALINKYCWHVKEELCKKYNLAA